MSCRSETEEIYRQQSTCMSQSRYEDAGLRPYLDGTIIDDVPWQLVSTELLMGIDAAQFKSRGRGRSVQFDC